MIVGHSRVWGANGPRFGIGHMDPEREEVEIEVWKTARMVFFGKVFGARARHEISDAHIGTLRKSVIFAHFWKCRN